MNVIADTELPGALPTAVATRPQRSARTFLRYLPFAIWFVALAAVMSALAITHWLALPTPSRDDTKLHAGIAALVEERPGWAAVHTLYTDCRCSQRVIDHLKATERPAGVSEIVLLVGEDQGLSAGLRHHGFEVVPVTAETLFSRFGIEGAPLLLVVDPQRHIRYAGGYTTRKQGPDVVDLAILRDLRAGSAPTDLPVYGCAVSQRLKELADPLAIKR